LNSFLPELGKVLSAEALAAIGLWESLLAREKQALSRVLHQDVAQALTALRLDLALFIRQQSPQVELVSKANQMLNLVDSGLQSVVSLLGHLQPPTLDQGLPALLQHVCLDFSQRYGLPCRLISDDECLGFDAKHGHAVFAIVTEALSNIARHAQAKNVGISCRQNDGGIEIEVFDDGCGFDVAKAFTGSGLGLQAMQWRAVAMGGRLNIHSQPQSGVSVKLILPCC
jgi:signal transduction histidine kinase